MYAGEIVEVAPVNELFAHPTHPYTELLLRSIPRVDRDTGGLSTIAGQVPAIGAMPSGDSGPPWRCPLRQPVCTTRDPVLVPLPDARPSGPVGGARRTGRGRTAPDPVLTVTGLRESFTVTRGFPRSLTAATVRALDGISFQVRDGEAFGLVGESGCGKSTAGAPRCACSSPTPARSSSRARTWSRRASRVWRCCAASCRSSSRIRTRRSIRAGGSARR